MPINQDTHYVIKNGIVEQPAVVKDGLELYYDAKGKHNSDVHKGTLLDLSGNNRHGTLVNFAYEGVSGYQENGTGGILLDDVDDKIIRPVIPNIQYTSASRNIFESIQTEWESGTFSNYLTDNIVNTTRIRQASMSYALELNTTYTVSVANGYVVNLNVNSVNMSYAQSLTFTPTSNNGLVRFVIKRVDEANITTAELITAKFQLEKNSIASNYTPYIPLPIITYQLNGNILSFEKDGTVKRTTKDANGNRITVSRKGINLVRNGNFANEMNKWAMNGDLSTKVEIDSGVVKATAIKQYGGVGQTISSTSFATGHKLYFGAHVKTNSSTLRLYLNDGVTQISAVNTSVENNGFYLRHGILTVANNGVRLYVIFQDNGTSEWVPFEATKIQAIDLTEAYGAGNEPDLAYIQAHPEEFAWTPNPNDLIETVEIKNNLVGDLENLQGNDFEQHEDGVVTYTNEAEEGSVVRVDIDGISFQDVGSGKNIFYKNEVYSKYSEINDDCINISIGDRFFYQIDGVYNAQYTTSFDYERDNTTAPISMSFYYTDGTSDENSQIMSSSDRVKLTLSSAIGKTVSGVGYNPPVVLGCSWKKISNPTMDRTGLAINTAQEDSSLGVRWNKLQNPIMERV